MTARKTEPMGSRLNANADYQDRVAARFRAMAAVRDALRSTVNGDRVNGRLIRELGEADLLTACRQRQIELPAVLAAAK